MTLICNAYNFMQIYHLIISYRILVSWNKNSSISSIKKNATLENYSNKSDVWEISCFGNLSQQQIHLNYTWVYFTHTFHLNR